MGRILATEDPGIVMTAVYPGVIKTKGGHWEKILEIIHLMQKNTYQKDVH